MTAIYKKELKSYFNGMTGYVFIAFMLFIVGLYFTALNLTSHYPNFEYALNNATFMFLIVIPILTMRVIADEKRQKTDQLLFTAPVSVTSVILGKYLAMLTVFLIPMILICLYPVILARYGTVNLSSAYSAIIGFYFLGSSLIAVGMFMSSLTENQIIAAVLTFMLIMSGYFMNGIIGFISTSAMASLIAFTVIVVIAGAIVYIMTKNTVTAVTVGIIAEAVLAAVYLISPSVLEGTFTTVLGCFAFFDRLNSFIQGIFDITGLVYYLSMIFIFVFLTVQSVQKRRWS